MTEPGTLRRFFTWRLRPGDVVRDLAVCAAFGTLAGLGAGAHWFLDFFVHFPLHYLLVLAPVSLLLWAMRRYKSAAFCTACAIYHVFLLAPLFRGPPADGPPPEAALRVMEINLLRENGRTDEALRSIREAEADVVVALELTPAWLEHLAPLRAQYPHVVAEAQDDCFGLGVFSKHPLTGARTLWLGYGWVPTLRLTVEADGRSLDVVATHAVPPKERTQTGARDEQLRDLAGLARERTRPLLIVGDLNITPWSPHFRALLREGGLMDSGRGHGLGGTWPSFVPAWLRIPIDHVLVTPELRVLNRSRGRSFGSDHVPLVVDVGYTRAALAAR